MTIDFKTATTIVPHVLAIKKPVLFRGRHGIGKSEVVYQIAKGLGLQVVERRASQMTEGDLVGLPSVENGTTTFCPPDWFAECCASPRVLFLDEIDRATVEVRQGIFELTDSRKLNGHTLHTGTLIFGCVNGGAHAAQYQVGEMDPAELDRWTVFDLEPTVEDWLTWAKNRVDGLVYDFIKANPKHLEHGGEFEPNKVYPSRRSWARLNSALVVADLLKENTRNDALLPLAMGFVGQEAAFELEHFVKNYSRRMSPQDVVDGGQYEKAAKLDHAQRAALVEKIADVYFKDELLTDNQIKNLAEFYGVLNAEIAQMLYTKTSEFLNRVGAPGDFIKFHTFRLSDGRLVSEIMVSNMTGGAV